MINKTSFSAGQEAGRIQTYALPREDSSRGQREAFPGLFNALSGVNE